MDYEEKVDLYGTIGKKFRWFKILCFSSVVYQLDAFHLCVMIKLKDRKKSLQTYKISGPVRVCVCVCVFFYYSNMKGEDGEQADSFVVGKHTFFTLCFSFSFSR